MNFTHRYPIILVYGFMGFDSISFTPLSYWGGTIDLAKELRRLGYEVHVASIGAVSSNHDRACELFAAIRGGRVDYGEAHAARWGHSRYGRNYEGCCPDWGQIDPAAGEIKKVHLIGHSMGGQTSRLLVSLLEEGDEEERRAGGEADSAGALCSPLFDGGHPWVCSVTTLSTPHDGTTITHQYLHVGMVKRIFAKWLAVESVRRDRPIIDLQLRHWETQAREEEGLEEFIRRAVEEELWKRMEDFSFFDLTLTGAAKLNRRARTSRQTYYFSWAASASAADFQTGHHLPAKGTNLPLQTSVRFIGSLDPIPGHPEEEPSRWWESDGIVNTCSMDGPKIDSEDLIVSYPGLPEEPQRGVWNFLGRLHPYDHWRMHIAAPLLGSPPPGYDSLLDFYLRHCELLKNIEEL
jgi:triacylglycerol lipase